MTDGLLLRTSEGCSCLGCSCLAPPPRAGLAVIFCLTHLAAGSGETAVKETPHKKCLQLASPLRDWGCWGQGRAHLELQHPLALLPASVLRSLARKKHLLESG